MRSVLSNFRSALIVRVAIVGAVGAMAAGCSSDASRFGGSFFGGDTSTEYTGSIPPTPTEPVTGAPLGDPRGQAAYNQLGSVPSGNGDGSSVIVGPGETVFTIATRYGVPATALMKVNGISDPNTVQQGQRLIIPVFSQAQNGWVRPDQAGTPVKLAGPAPVSAPKVASTSQAAKAATGGIHTVAPGETVYSLGRLYGVSPNAIIAANNLDAPYGIRIGQKVRIPGATVAKSAPAPKVASAPKSEADTASSQQQAALAPAPAPAAKSGIESSNLAAPTPEKTNYSPQNDASSGTDTRAAIPEPGALSAGNFRWPVRGRIISSYGEKNDGGTNDGINVSVPEGTSVRAAENGVVAYAGNELKGYGNLVLIRHADDWVTAYAHNSELLVKRGDVVSRGQVIAKAGQTGTVSTPQIHFELRKGSTPVDPLKYLASD